MKLFKKLKQYKTEESQDSVIGLGILKAKDYDKDKYGHLILLSLNTKVVSFIKKLFILF